MNCHDILSRLLSLNISHAHMVLLMEQFKNKRLYSKVQSPTLNYDGSELKAHIPLIKINKMVIYSSIQLRLFERLCLD